jgi:hypothetical protein
MLKLRLAVTLFALFFTTSAFAQLKPYQDYDISDNVWSITTVQVNANMINNYLEGIEKTWVASQKVAKDLKHIEDYYVYTSDLPNSGSFNVLLVTRYKSGADLIPSKARYEAFMKEWGAEREAQNEKIVKDYPAMRNITGEYQMHRVTFK